MNQRTKQGRRHTMETNERMDELFSRARTQAPKTSYEQTSQAFQVGIAALAGGGILSKWAALSLKFKLISMTTVISIISVTSVLVVSTLSTKNVEKQPIKSSDKEIQYTPKNEAEMIQEDSETKEISLSQNQQPSMNATHEKSQETIHEAFNVSGLEKLGISMIPRDLQAFNRKLAPTSMIKQPKIAQDSLTMKLFEISEKTTNAEIEAIKQQAVAAGLEFDFSTKVRQDKIKKLDLHMKKGNNKWMSKISGTDSFSFTFGWWEDSEGKYVKYICDDDLARICGDCD